MATRRRAKAAGQEQQDHLKPEEKEQVSAAGAVQATGIKPDPGHYKVDLHCHSEASADCSTPLELIPARCIEREVHIQAITDHNCLWGAQELKEMVLNDTHLSRQLQIIVGEEISTSEGEIVGLFLKELVEPGLSPEETAKKIHAQGGLVMIPHGFDPLKRWRLRPEALARIIDDVDIIETFNARISDLRWNRAAVDWAIKHQLPMSAGSDAHRLVDIGAAWSEIPALPVYSPLDLVIALKESKPVGLWTHPIKAYLLKSWERFLRRVNLRT